MATSDGLAVSVPERERDIVMPVFIRIIESYMGVMSGQRNLNPTDDTDGNVLSSSGRHSTLEGSSGKSGAGGAKSSGTMTKEKVKIGHRRVDETGTVTYKKKPLSELMAAIQLGIGQSVGGLSSKPERDLLMQDFAVVESVFYPAEGSNLTPAHHYSDFRFKTYAPVACRYFRDLFGIQADDFLLSLCDKALKELSNPGASGSIFYLTQDDEFIIKTVQHKESEFLQKLLPGYYMNLNQNPRTLLPKFYGFYCYQCGGKNIRFVIMNNMLPTSVKLHEKYDLKGSTHKRKASKHERAKSTPTYKDLDFIENHPEGILLEKDKYDAFIKTMQRDCRVLESFKIMDYSLLLGIYNLDIAKRQKVKDQSLDRASTTASKGDITNLNSSLPESQMSMPLEGPSDSQGAQKPGNALSRSKSMKQRVAQYSTAIESIQAQSRESDEEEEDDDDIPTGGIPAKNGKGERLLLYLGIIDILQSYRLKKKLEHTMKSIVIDADTISVHRPSYYCQRFQDFMANKVFRKMPTLEPPTFKATQHFRKVVRLALKHSPSKRKPVSTRKPNHQSESEYQGEPRRYQDRGQRTISFSEEGGLPAGTHGGRPDLLPENSTPPPSFSEAINATSEKPTYVSGPETSDMRYNQPLSGTFQYQAETGYPVSPKSSVVRSSSPQSMSESTPTHTEYTEGTPSYTPSSPSCYSDIESQFQAELERDEVVASASGIGSPAKGSTSTGFVPQSSSKTSTEDSRTINNGQGPSSNVCDDDVSKPSIVDSDRDKQLSVDTEVRHTVNIVISHDETHSRDENSSQGRLSSVGKQEQHTDKNQSNSVSSEGQGPIPGEGEGQARANGQHTGTDEEEMAKLETVSLETDESGLPIGLSQHWSGGDHICRMLRNLGNIKHSNSASSHHLGNTYSLELHSSRSLNNPFATFSTPSQLTPPNRTKVMNSQSVQQEKTFVSPQNVDKRVSRRGDNSQTNMSVPTENIDSGPKGLEKGDRCNSKPCTSLSTENAHSDQRVLRKGDNSCESEFYSISSQVKYGMSSDQSTLTYTEHVSICTAKDNSNVYDPDQSSQRITHDNSDFKCQKQSKTSVSFPRIQKVTLQGKVKKHRLVTLKSFSAPAKSQMKKAGVSDFDSSEPDQC